jgi:hypothetical protein
MALLFAGMKCPLCGEPMDSEQPLFATWGVWLPESDALSRYCDAAMHWECYARWPERPSFARSYFEFWVQAEGGNPYWWRAFLDDNVFVTVNPAPSIESAWVHLAETGSRYDVRLVDWVGWLNEQCPDTMHPIETTALATAKAILGAAVPTKDHLLAQVDWNEKKDVLERIHQERVTREAVEKAQRRKTELHNRACERVYPVITKNGLKCPHCGQFSTDYRLSTRPNHRSLIICRHCGWDVNPNIAAQSCS